MGAAARVFGTRPQGGGGRDVFHLVQGWIPTTSKVGLLCKSAADVGIGAIHWFNLYIVMVDLL